MLNPWEGNYPLVCDWACHIARGSSGGDDYAMPVGTPILAAFDGTLTNRPPDLYPASGNVAILTRADGVAFYHLHLSQFVTPGPYQQGNVIGYSGGALGAPGSGQSTGPHLHVNAFDAAGRIHDIHDYYSTNTASTGTPAPITPTTPGETPMVTLAKATDGPAQWGVVYGGTKLVFTGDSVGAAAVRGWTKLAAIQQGIDPANVKVAELSGEEFVAVFE